MNSPSPFKGLGSLFGDMALSGGEREVVDVCSGLYDLPRNTLDKSPRSLLLREQMGLGDRVLTYREDTDDVSDAPAGEGSGEEPPMHVAEEECTTPRAQIIRRDYNWMGLTDSPATSGHHNIANAAKGKANAGAGLVGGYSAPAGYSTPPMKPTGLASRQGTPMKSTMMTPMMTPTKCPATPGTIGNLTPVKSPMKSPVRLNSPVVKRAVKFSHPEALARRIPTTPVRILDAPSILAGPNQLLDWGGNHLAVPLDNVLYLRNGITGCVDEHSKTDAPIASVRFSPTHQAHFSVACVHNIFTLDVATPGVSVTTYDAQRPVSCLAYTNDSLLVGDTTGGLTIFDTRAHYATQQLTHSEHSINSVSVSCDGLYSASVCEGGLTQIFCLRQGRLLHSFQQPGPVRDVAWTQYSSNVLATCGGVEGAVMTLLDMVHGKTLHSTLLPAEVNGMRWESDMLITCHGEPIDEHAYVPPTAPPVQPSGASSLRPFSSSLPELRTPFLAPTGSSAAAAASASQDPPRRKYDVLLWKATATDLQLLTSLHGHHEPVHHMTVSSDKTHLVTAGMDETVRFWELGSQKAKKKTLYSASPMESQLRIR